MRNISIPDAPAGEVYFPCVTGASGSPRVAAEGRHRLVERTVEEKGKKEGQVGREKLRMPFSLKWRHHINQRFGFLAFLCARTRNTRASHSKPR